MLGQVNIVYIYKKPQSWTYIFREWMALRPDGAQSVVSTLLVHGSAVFGWSPERRRRFACFVGIDGGAVDAENISCSYLGKAMMQGSVDGGYAVKWVLNAIRPLKR